MVEQDRADEACQGAPKRRAALHSEERCTLGPSPWPVCIFWDPPAVGVQSKTTLENDPRVERDQHHPEAASDPSNQEASTPTHGKQVNMAGQQPPVLWRTDLRHVLLVASGKVAGANKPTHLN